MQIFLMQQKKMPGNLPGLLGLVLMRRFWGDISHGVHAEKSFLNLGESNQIRILITIFRSI